MYVFVSLCNDLPLSRYMFHTVLLLLFVRDITIQLDHIAGWTAERQGLYP